MSKRGGISVCLSSVPMLHNNYNPHNLFLDFTRERWHLTPQGVRPNWLLIGKQELATEEIRTQ